LGKMPTRVVGRLTPPALGNRHPCEYRTLHHHRIEFAEQHRARGNAFLEQIEERPSARDAPLGGWDDQDAVAMNDRSVQAIVLTKPEHRAREDGIKTAIDLPAPKRAVDACVKNFRTALPILLDRPFLPLAAQIDRPYRAV
jgi:hypothetical protein